MRQRYGVLVAGATGYAASHLLAQMLADGSYRVFCTLKRGTVPCGTAGDAVLRAAVDAGIKDVVSRRLPELSVIPDASIIQQGTISSMSGKWLESMGIRSVWHDVSQSGSTGGSRPYSREMQARGVEESLMLAKVCKAETFNLISGAFVKGEGGGLGRVANGRSEFGYAGGDAFEKDAIRAEQAVLNATETFRARIIRHSQVVAPLTAGANAICPGLDPFVVTVRRTIAWVRRRVSDYFSHFPLRIYCARDAVVDVVSVDDLARRALSLSPQLKSSLEYIYFASQTPLSVGVIADALNAVFPDIHFEVVDDPEMLRPLDRVFMSALRFHCPCLVGDGARSELGGFAHDSAKAAAMAADSFVRSVGMAEERTRAKHIDFRPGGIRVLTALARTSRRCRHDERLDFYQAGEGPALVIINAYGMSVAMMEPMMSILSKRYRVITWESRGLSDMGRFRVGEGPTFGVEEQVEDLKEILDAAAVDSAHVVAWCSGAKVALRFCQKYPYVPRSLGLVAGTYHPFGGIVTEWEKSLINMMNTIRLMPVMTPTFIKIIPEMLSGSDQWLATPKPEEKAFELVSSACMDLKKYITRPFASEESIRNFARLTADYIATDVKPLLASVRVPALVLSAECDVVSSPGQSLLVASEIAGARSVCLPASTHWMMTESPQWVADELEDFIRSSGEGEGDVANEAVGIGL